MKKYTINEAECVAAGLDPKEVARIAAGISRYAAQAQKLEIQIFGGSSGQLRFDDGKSRDGQLILAHLDGMFSGGCGATHTDGEGFERGEGV